MSDAMLRCEGLSVEFRTENGWKAVTHEVSFSVGYGETVALVGESGSGKSVTAMSVLGLLPTSARSTGRILFGGEDLLTVPESRLRQIRGKEIAMVFQEPITALNPVYTIGEQLREAVLSHRTLSRAAADVLALDLLRQVEMPRPEVKLRHYPHQLSGGERQRAMIAMAISSEPTLLIADEPTTSLDVTIQAEILDLLLSLQKRFGMSILIITHDMAVVADVASRVIVMHDGVLVEEASVDELFAAPQEAYTRDLLSSVLRLGHSHVHANGGSGGGSSVGTPRVLELSDVVIEYPGPWRKPGFRAVNGVSLLLGAGEIVGLVGESGSGKSTIGRAVLGLIPITRGTLAISGQGLSAVRGRKRRELMRQVSMVFQDPVSSLNPRATIGESITNPLRWTGKERSARTRDAIARSLLDKVRIPPSWVSRYPHELSGGEHQRVGIARAIAVDPVLMVADEPTSALDVTVQAAVLRLFQELQRELGFSCLFISHDLSVVEALASRVAVLNHGVIVELGDTAQILHHARDPYTQRLLAAAPVPDPVVQRRRRADRVALTAANTAEQADASDRGR